MLILDFPKGKKGRGGVIYQFSLAAIFIYLLRNNLYIYFTIYIEKLFKNMLQFGLEQGVEKRLKFFSCESILECIDERITS